MKVLSLSQPYASLLFETAIGWVDKKAKSWETRPWKPGNENMSIVKSEGMLIHASSSDQYRYQTAKIPFINYIKRWEDLPFGQIIGFVKVGQIITTQTWLDTHQHHSWEEEQSFGDYTHNRWAWELKEAKKFEKPIKDIKGALNLWNLPENLFSLLSI